MTVHAACDFTLCVLLLLKTELFTFEKAAAAFSVELPAKLVTLHASCGTVYCNRSCLFVGGWVCLYVGGSVTTITRNYVH